MKKYLLLFIKIFISGFLLYFIVQRLEWRNLIATIQKGDIKFIGAGILFGMSFNLIKFAKWHILIKSGNHAHSYWDGAKSYMIGNTVGVITPMRAGDLARALYFPPGNRSRIIGLTIIDRVMDLVCVLILSVGGGFLLIGKGFGILLVILSMAVLIMVFSSASILNTFKKIFTARSVVERFDRISSGLTYLDLQTLALSLFLSFLAFLCIIVEFYYIIMAFEKTELYSVFLATPLVTLSALLPVTFMGLGVREGLSVYLFSMLGVTAATGFSTAFLGFAINNLSLSIIGVFLLYKHMQ